jgi:RNA polymerase sigma-70 factor (ECF subfamily)
VSCCIISFFVLLQGKINTVISSEEREIISKLKKGDGAALQKLFMAYHPALCQLAYRFMQDREQSKDLVQDVFIKLWNSRDTLQITATVGGYLKKAVVNTCLNAIERNQRQRKVSLDDLKVDPHMRSSEDEYQYRELETRLSTAIEKLPVRTRAVFTLIRFDEMSYQEASEMLSISTKAVEKEMMKALRLLRESLHDYLPAAILAIILNH